MKTKLYLVMIFILTVALMSGTSSPARAAESEAMPYIIVFKDAVNPSSEAPGLAKAHELQPGFVYQHAIKGISALVPPGRLEALRHDPRVAYVVEDALQSIDAEPRIVPTGIQRIFANNNPELGIDGNDDVRVDVDVAVIDTGVDVHHPDLNVVSSVNCYNFWPFTANCVRGGEDDNGHGTHVAGTIGAIDNGVNVVLDKDYDVVGVAPGARIWSVKVLNSSGSGYVSQIIAGIDWVAARADSIEVANMSLGGSGFNQAEYDAIQGAVNKGVAFAVAAGNDHANAQNYSPGGFDNVLSVSALADFDGLPGWLGAATCRTDVDDTLADFSNFGAVIDISAPGVCILSTLPLEQSWYGWGSGTSMASPHAAGALALLASMRRAISAAEVIQLYNTVKSSGNFDWTDDSGDGIKEPLLDVSNASLFTPAFVPGTGGIPPAAPTNLAAVAKSSSQVGLSWTDNSSNETGFTIKRCAGVGCNSFTQIATLSPNIITYTDSGLTASASYTYQVRAYNAAGDSNYAMISITMPATPTPPVAPTNLTATSVSKSRIDLAWTDNSGNEDGFSIERCKGTTCTNFGQIARVTANVTSYANTGLSANTSYRYRVRAYNAAGTSGYSNTATAKTLSR